MAVLAKRNLRAEIEELTDRLEDAEGILRALRNREVDAMVLSGPEGDQVFTLQGAETPYRLMVESMNEGALTVGSDGTILYCNHRFAQMVGRPMEKIVGSGCHRYFVQGDRAAIRALLSESRDERAKGEFTLQAGNRSLLAVHLSAGSVDLDGVAAVVIFVTDITELKSTQEQLRRMNELLEKRVKARTSELALAKEKLALHAAELEERVHNRTVQLKETIEDLEAFSHSVSHDLRAPLRSIQSFAQIVSEECDGSLNEEHRDYLRRVVASASRMDKLILDVLSYARISRATPVEQAVALDSLVRDVINYYPVLHSPSVRVEIKGPLPGVLGHEAALSQCVSNLLCNAVKFVASGVDPHIRIRAEILGDRARIWFEDNGIGIAPADQQRIFRIFERGGGVGDYTGTGIGLSVVKRAIEKMGGSVGVESEKGNGSRFWIELKAYSKSRA